MIMIFLIVILDLVVVIVVEVLWSRLLWWSWWDLRRIGVCTRKQHSNRKTDNSMKNVVSPPRPRRIAVEMRFNDADYRCVGWLQAIENTGFVNDPLLAMAAARCGFR